MKKLLDMKKLVGGVAVGVAVACWTLIIAGVVGWFLNVYALTQCDFEPKYRAEAIRGIGVVIPFVGAVAGWVEIEDE